MTSEDEKGQHSRRSPVYVASNYPPRAFEMEMVGRDEVPHDSHVFGKKMSSLVACASNDRFGQIRTCKKCNGREVWAGGSHYVDDRLLNLCAPYDNEE